MEGALRPGADAPDLRLIETMLWDGEAVQRLGLHLARLSRGAAALGWPFDMAVLRKAVSQLPDEPARLRITLDRAGQVMASVTALPPAKALWRLGLAPARLRSDDPWLRIKSTNRAAYDAARAALPAGLDEVVFQNERGEVCDGTITTLFFDRGAGLRTPPLSSGLLPGILRESLNCPEEVLLAQDLPRVQLWVGNALRGLIRAEWAG